LVARPAVARFTFDGPARGVRCAQEIVGRTADLGFELRAGLHTGECEIVDHDIGGMAVNIGARIAALAGGGEVLVSSTVRDLIVGSGIEFAERGSQELKGVPGEWRIYRVVDAAAPPSARPAPDECELRPSDRALVAAGRRAPRLAHTVIGRYRRRRG
jgi:class 3 adenylate cyclase